MVLVVAMLIFFYLPTQKRENGHDEVFCFPSFSAIGLRPFSYWMKWMLRSII